jgi:hypothetical protein
MLNDLVSAPQVDAEASLVHHRLKLIGTQLRSQLQQAIRAIQAAHHWQLSVDMLNSTRLHDLFRAAQVKDQINNCKLLISHPSDLF